MVLFTRRNNEKTVIIPLVLLFIFLGSLVPFQPINLMAAALQTQKPTESQLTLTLSVPVKPAATPVKLAPKKIIRESRLLIPRINVDTNIKNMGLTSDGAMAVPDSNSSVGWYSLGTRPGEVGSAVIGGHNRWNKRAAVFVRLDQLVKGDLVSIVDAQGVSMSFVVRETRTYNPTDDGTSVFLSKSGAHLNLITCSGVWDPSTQSYTTRLVVFTDAIETAQKS